MSQVSISKKSKDKSTKKRTRKVVEDDQDETARMSKKIIAESNHPNEIIVIKKQLTKDLKPKSGEVNATINIKPQSSKKTKTKRIQNIKKQERQQQKQQISVNTRSRKDKIQQSNAIQEERIVNPHSAQQQESSMNKEKKKKKKRKEKENTIERMEQQKINSSEKDQLSSQIEQNTKESSTIVKKKKSKKKKQKEINQKQNPLQNESIPEKSQYDQQLSTKAKQEDKDKGDSSSKSKNKAKKQSAQSINVLNRQMSRQCILPKSNFYLQKQDNLRKGLPVGRGSKKQAQRIIKERKKEVWQRSKRNKQLKLMRQVKQQVKQQQDESNKSISLDKKSMSKDGGKKGKVQECTREQSIRILNIFQGDAGDYRGMVKQLKTIPLKKIRAHLRMHFQRCIEIITRKAQESGRKIDDWDLNQKRQIVRELHRIRCTNRLLSEQNSEFRQKFMKLMRSYNDSSLTLEVIDYNFLYRKIQAFVRGFCTLNKRKVDHKFTEPTQQNRKHLLEGGYIMDLTRTLKREVKIQCKQQAPQSNKIDLQKIIYQWTEQQQNVLGKLYIENQSYESIIEQLKKKFGERNRWKDFQILGRKIDHLVKMGINKMFDLTCKPYNRAQRLNEEENKIKSQPKEQKCLDPSQMKTGVNSLDLMTKFIYNNKKALIKPEEPPENPIFKNISLLERQIFGHVESFKVRHALVNLLREQFPPQEDLNIAIKLAKQFAAFAQEWQRQNNILQIKKQQCNDEDWLEGKKQKLQVEGRQISSEDEQQNQQGDKFDELVKQLAQYQQEKNISIDRQLDLIPSEYELKQGDLDQINQEKENLNQDIRRL